MKALKLASLEDDRRTIVEVGHVQIGGPQIVIMAGPCAVESRDQLLMIASTLKALGADMLRGGAFKPRTSPYSFRGLEEEGLKMLAEARELTGLPVVTEVMDARDIALVAEYSDMLQIGSRNMQNFTLLHEVGKCSKPVLLKRGLSATLEEWLFAAEYILAAGNRQVVLCERGIRTFESWTRNTVDITAVPAVKELSHLPIVLDPSHGTGRWKMVPPVSKAAVAAGADGLIIEVHPEPECALSDGPQSLTPENFEKLMSDLRRLAPAVGRAIQEN